MTLELEMLVLAWDNYKKSLKFMTAEEIEIEAWINRLLDSQPSVPKLWRK